MKTFSVLIAALAGLLFLVACNKDSTQDNNSSQEEVARLSALSISITDAGFLPDESAESYTRDFVAGDKVGVFSVREGAVVEGQSNLCYEAVDSGSGRLVWVLRSDNPGTFYGDALYYVYYPYDADFSYPVNPDAEDTREFFAEVVSGHETAVGQSEKSNFDASDLMLGSAVISESNSVNFVMEHLMALVVIELPSEYYTFDNDSPEIPDYVLSVFSDPTFDSYEPWQSDDYTFMYIVKPEESVELSGAYTDAAGESKTWDEQLGPQEGYCYLLSIDGGKSAYQHTLSYGDFFLSDGRLLSKDASSEEVAAADVIGIVFQMDQDRMDPAIAESLGGVSHALVMSTQAVKDDNDDADLYLWGQSRDETVAGLNDTYGAYDLGANYRLIQRDIYGFSNRESLREKRSDFPDSYPVFAAVDSFYEICGGPLESAPSNTGWYLPCAGEWLDIIRNLTGIELDLDDSDIALDGAGHVYWSNRGTVITLLNEPLEKISDSCKDDFFIGGGWWTASICGTDSARVMAFNDEGYVHCRWTWRSVSFYARAVLAF